MRISGPETWELAKDISRGYSLAVMLQVKERDEAWRLHLARIQRITSHGSRSAQTKACGVQLRGYRFRNQAGQRKI